MRLSASIQLIWQLAGAEAAAGQFKEIQAEHFCLGLLKLADLPAHPASKLGLNEAIVRALGAEIDLVRQVLGSRGIDPTLLRRALRRSLGKGDCPFRGGQMHRAQACRELFDTAARTAGEAGHETLTAVHLLEVILNSPTSALAQALSDFIPRGRPMNLAAAIEKLRGQAAPTIARAEQVSRTSKTSLLDKHGQDLTKIPLRTYPELPPPRTVEAKVLLEALKHRGAVLLVGSSEQTALEVLLAAASALKLKGRRVIVLSRAAAAENPEGRELWKKIFAEAAKARDVILYVPPITAVAGRGKTRSEEADWEDFLREVAQQSAAFICRVSTEVFEEQLRKEPVWRRQAQVIWIQETKLKSIPREL
jgi:ATP-dependent Clp protease ATP-binding subunit ClpA